MTQLNLLKLEMDSNLTSLADTSRGSCNMNDRDHSFVNVNVFETKEWAGWQGEASMDMLKGKIFSFSINKTYFPNYFVMPLI